MPITRKTTTTVIEEDDGAATSFPSFNNAPAAPDLLSADRSATATRFPVERLEDQDTTRIPSPAQAGFSLKDHWQAIGSGMFVAIGLICTGVWYMSKQDADLQQAKQEIKDLSAKVDRLREEVTKLGVQVEQQQKRR